MTEVPSLTYSAKSGKRYSSAPPNRNVRRSKANVIKSNRFDTVPPTSVRQTVVDTWSLFFPDGDLEKFVITPTNQQRRKRIEATNDSITRDKADHAAADCGCRGRCRCGCHRDLVVFEPVVLTRLKAFLGLLYGKGVSKLQGQKVSRLFEEDAFQLPFFGGVMSRNEFLEILRDLRFDDRDTR